MLKRWEVWKNFLKTQKFKRFFSSGENKSRFLYWTKGGKELFYLGCGQSAENFPDDILPCDLMLGTWQNGILFNSLYGTSSLNLCSSIVQDIHLRDQGTQFPMAVSLEILPKLTTTRKILKTILDARYNPEKYLVKFEDVVKAIPYSGATSVLRIVNHVLKYCLD
jgi:hypothetical protein